MGNIAIQVENLSKRYRIGTQEKKHDTLTAAAFSWLKSPLNNFRRLRSLTAFSANGDEADVLYALQDISFTVNQGEVVGIIGRNGAGKSTLLKILSRITPPSDGRIILNGRVASLLEVGTGFHPELTGRENVYLNGTVLGMTKTEVDSKFDEIVDFSGVEKFIDTPVKWYSSGMRVRLAFSVAAHLEPEILLVDEVLAVGDMEFQKKCLGQMGKVAASGRTVFFVSHNMAAIKQLCPRSILLKEGQLCLDDESEKVVNHYLADYAGENEALVEAGQLQNRSGIGGGKITKLYIQNNAGTHTNVLGLGEPFQINFEFELSYNMPRIVAGVEIKTLDGFPLINLRSDSQGVVFGPYNKTQIHRICIDVPGIPLYPGSYYLEPWFAESKGQRVDHLHESLVVSFESVGKFKSESMIQPGKGIIVVDCDWSG